MEEGHSGFNFHFRGRSYVDIRVRWKGLQINLVNIYAPGSTSDRRVLWSELLVLGAASSDVLWCLGGDFNEVTAREERLGGGINSSRRGMEEFRDFIGSMGVEDIPCVGGKFTWFKDNGKSMSRIDRFLVSKSLLDVWGVVDLRIGKRDISDHTPIRLKFKFIDWGPKPFRFNNAWFKHDEFKFFIKEEWAKLSVKGRGDFVLFEKLKGLKESLKVWNRETFGWIDLKVEKEAEMINDMDVLVVDKFGGSIDDIIEKRREAFSEFRNMINLKECMLRLRSRQL
ncbi:uncharacterized protein LOC131619638 [Vicia villosa]|uniref:uncharacterized protein LOC131619638 n=1 Tax=Vicia villosa TaxID=3911 RepID=UPI00273B5CFB|nr:uncharacterized protein LOC131619638 [Vicia villosa]